MGVSSGLERGGEGGGGRKGGWEEVRRWVDGGGLSVARF